MKSSGTHDNDQDQWEYQLDKLNVDLNNMILSLAMAAFFTWNVIIHMNTKKQCYKMKNVVRHTI